MACNIAWCAFSWEAFATLATGLAAVFAAWQVGRRQVAIAKRQTELLSQQAVIQNLTLRHELFDRRFEIYAATEEFLADIVRSGARAEQLKQTNFSIARNKSRLLFNESVVRGLDEIWTKVWEFYQLKSRADLTNSNQGSYNQDEYAQKDEALNWLSDRLETLPQLFAEMKLERRRVDARI